MYVCNIYVCACVSNKAD